MKTKIHSFITICFLLSTHLALGLPGGGPAETSVSPRETFDRAYRQVFGPDGSQLHYKVNIVGVYKTEGTIWQKGKRSKYQSAKSIVWNDGKTAYILDRKKKEINIYNASDPKRDKHASKFTFNPDDYTYTSTTDKEGLHLTLKAKNTSLKGINEARILLNPTTYTPISARIKVAFIWTHVQISQFQAGGIDESIFTFPAKQYEKYKKKDKRQT